MTLTSRLKKGELPAEIAYVSKDEKVPVKTLTKRVLDGTVVIPANVNHKMSRYYGVGKGLRIKINANIGTSPVKSGLKEEFKKLEMALKYGAESIMDLSTGGDIDHIRKELLSRCSAAMFGTVPAYQCAVEAVKKWKTLLKMTPAQILEVIEKHGEDGVDFITVHSGITGKTLEHLKKKKRLMGVVSRGGAFIIEWMIHNKKENPFNEYYDDIVKIAAKHNMTLSLGDGLRPGCLKDANDPAQFDELKTLGALAAKAKKSGVQVIIEGPGHVPIHKIKENITLQKKLTGNAPFYILGPLVTDVAPGYDHITSAIGGALAGMYGADFLCYVTPSEHLSLPGLQDVRYGVVASKIAAHAADIARLGDKAMAWDNTFSSYRKARDWEKQKELSMDPVKFDEYLTLNPVKKDGICAMCGEFCSIKVFEKMKEL